MCAIVDNNVRHEVFGAEDVQSEAGRHLLRWLNNRKGRLVVGGKLLDELSEYGGFRSWFGQALQSGRAIEFPKAPVDAETSALQARHICRSNDAHVLALAIVSGARLLFTNDEDLQADFKNPRIISGVRGRVYTTSQRKDVRSSHRNLLNRTDLCTT